MVLRHRLNTVRAYSMRRSLPQPDGDVWQAVLQRWWLCVVNWHSGEQSVPDALSGCPLLEQIQPGHP